MKRILVLGFICHSFCLAQLPGDFDATYSVDGKTTIDLGASNSNGIWAIATQTNGKLVVAGESQSLNSLFLIGRINSSSASDATFSGDGAVTTSFFSGYDAKARAVAVQPDGKIVAAGFTNSATGYDFAVVRLLTTGTFDNTFSGNGRHTTDLGSAYDEAWAVAIQPDGKILVAGKTFVTSHYEFAIVRYLDDGSLDTTFDDDGIANVNMASGCNAMGMVIQSDGKIVVTGPAQNGGGNDIGVARLNIDGSLDTSFGTGGKTIVDIGSNDEPWGIAIQGTGRIVIGGQTNNDLSSDFGLIRLKTDGTLDSTWNGTGIQTTDFSGGDYLLSLTNQPDNKIVAAGMHYEASGLTFCFSRYDEYGELDNSFGTSGKVQSTFGFGNSIIRAVTLQPDLKIIAGGEWWDVGFSHSGFVRLLSGIYIGIMDFSQLNASILLYPNPVSETAELKYTLVEEETLRMEIKNMNGETVQIIQNDQIQEAGDHHLNIRLNPSLASGNYFIVITSPKGSATIKIMKI